MELTTQKLGYWRSEIEFVELLVRFTPPSPFWHYPVGFYYREFTFKENLLYLLTKHNVISSLDILKPGIMGHPGGYSLFFQTIKWYDLGEFVGQDGMLDVDIALLENQRVSCGRLKATDRTGSTLDNTQESMELEDSSVVAVQGPYPIQ